MAIMVLSHKYSIFKVKRAFRTAYALQCYVAFQIHVIVTKNKIRDCSRETRVTKAFYATVKLGVRKTSLCAESKEIHFWITINFLGTVLFKKKLFPLRTLLKHPFHIFKYFIYKTHIETSQQKYFRRINMNQQRYNLSLYPILFYTIFCQSLVEKCLLAIDNRLYL